MLTSLCYMCVSSWLAGELCNLLDKTSKHSNLPLCEFFITTLYQAKANKQCHERYSAVSIFQQGSSYNKVNIKL